MVIVLNISTVVEVFEELAEPLNNSPGLLASRALPLLASLGKPAVASASTRRPG
jgi:hypothetical protein